MRQMMMTAALIWLAMAAAASAREKANPLPGANQVKTISSFLALLFSFIVSNVGIAQEPDRTVLPPASPEFRGTIGANYKDSTPDWRPALPLTAPHDSPNVLLIVLDDVGFGHLECYGGPIDTPNLDKLAAMGLRYNNFHTTALCSPQIHRGDRKGNHQNRLT